MTRSIAERVRELVGPEVLEIDDPSARWPALGSLRVADETLPVALWLGRVGLSHRGRDDVERRFQNPAQDRPIRLPIGRTPLLLGLWDSDPIEEVPTPVLVSADPVHRQERRTRFSVFATLDALRAASLTGWQTSDSTTGERVTCFHPALLPVIAASTEYQVSLPSAQVLLGAFEVTTAEPAERDERRRRVTSTLVRAARFSRAVLDAYAGRCAMCELGMGLVESAHIHPASAPGSSDEVWNGVALCRNHHGAFDRHMVWVDPDTRRIRMHPAFVESRSLSRAHASFADDTRATLVDPLDTESYPRADMFRLRYAHFEGGYDWVDD